MNKKTMTLEELRSALFDQATPAEAPCHTIGAAVEDLMKAAT